MRVQLKDDSGAVAVVVALLLVVLVGMAAFITDFGAAYVSKRQLQSSADAGSLAAAQELGKYPGTCTDVASSSTARAAALAAAEQYASANRAGDRARTDWRIACSADHRTIEVTYANAATTPRFLGAIFGSQAYRAERTATAAVGVPSAGYGLRPYFVCLSDALALRAAPASAPPVQVAFPNAACGNQPGNWYTADCPEDGQGNGTPVLAVNTRIGCESTISVVDTTAAAGDPVAIQQLLLAACAGTPPLSAQRGCLTGNTGNLPSEPDRDRVGRVARASDLAARLPAWDRRGDGEQRAVPGQGHPGRHGLRLQVELEVRCAPPRSSATVSRSRAATTTSSSKYDLQVSGSLAPFLCAVGDPTCDFGSRSVRLVK